MNIWRFAELLAEVPQSSRITMGEGDTPLVRSVRIGPSAGLERLYFKLESSNPSGSYKDRFAAAAVSHVRAQGKSACIGTSSGNTGSALAAYCARAGMPCVLAIVEGAPEGKLMQMMAHGAHLVKIRGFGGDPRIVEQVMKGLQNLSREFDAVLQISAFRFSPDGMNAVQTISFELAEQLPDGIGHVFSPSGGGGLTLAVSMGFECLRADSRWRHSSAVHCVQPEGNDTIATPLRDGRSRAQTVTCSSAISGLQVASVIDGHETLVACRASGGNGYPVSDEAIYTAQQRLSREEGIFSEPAGATALAGCLDAVRRGEIDPESTIVCLVTGSGFKDERSVREMIREDSCLLVDSFEEFTDKCREALAMPTR